MDDPNQILTLALLTARSRYHDVISDLDELAFQQALCDFRVAAETHSRNKAGLVQPTLSLRAKSYGMIHTERVDGVERTRWVQR